MWKNSFLGLVLILMGCNEGNERLKENAAIEGKAQSEVEIAAENANLAQKAADMEMDLATRHRFYQAVKGTYEGGLQTELGVVRVRLTLVPSLPPYKTPRIRQLDEIVSDLNNLYFNVQVVQWNGANPLSAVGCRTTQIRPNIVSGEIYVTAESCSNLYALRIAESGMQPDVSNLDISSHLSLLVREGKLALVETIVGEVHPSTNASIYKMSVSRKQP